MGTEFRRLGKVEARAIEKFLLALGVLCMTRLRQEQLYSTLWAIRLLFCIGWLGFYFYTRDPYFLVLFVSVGIGFVWTGINLWRERKNEIR